jgi:hypothetical protein
MPERDVCTGVSAGSQWGVVEACLNRLRKIHGLVGVRVTDWGIPVKLTKLKIENFRSIELT